MDSTILFVFYLLWNIHTANFLGYLRLFLQCYKNHTYSNVSSLIRSDCWKIYTEGIVVGQDIRYSMSIIELSALIYLKDIAASVTRAVG